MMINFNRYSSKSFQKPLSRLLQTKAAAQSSPSSITSGHKSSAALITRLPNGIRVISDSEPSHFLGLGVYVNVGTRDEGTKFRGLNHICERLLFKASETQSRQQIVQFLELMGGQVMSASSRESLLYQATMLPHHLPEYMRIVRDSFLQMHMAEDEIAEAKQLVQFQWEHIADKMDSLTQEWAHEVAFDADTLGASSLCPVDKLETMTAEKIQEFRKLYFRPSNLVFSSAGSDHQSVCALIEQNFGEYRDPVEPLPKRNASQYIGGQLVRHMPDLDLAHLFVGFPGESLTSDSMYAISVLQTLLGGGNSFSAGGPGKGMYSRLYTRVLNRYYWVECVQALHFSYSDNGLFGFYCSCPHQGISRMIQAIGDELKDLLKNPVDEIELSRAKNQLRSQVFMNLEAKSVHCEDMGRQLQLTEKFICPKEMSEKIEQVTAQDIHALIKRMSSAKGTLVIAGNQDYAPNTKKLRSSLHSFGQW